MGLNIDAEEADRLDLSLDVIEAVLSRPRARRLGRLRRRRAGLWQARRRRSSTGCTRWPTTLDRRIMVRLVKGAYWDTEIKRAQVDGLADFPVFTRKAATDVSYICCARKLLGADRPHLSAIRHPQRPYRRRDPRDGATDPTAFEFQRLHGMGEALHDHVLKAEGTRCRIYAPVGAHRDLLAYLVRRLLENGANSLLREPDRRRGRPARRVAADPFAALAAAGAATARSRPRRPLRARAARTRAACDLRDPRRLPPSRPAARPWRAACLGGRADRRHGRGGQRAPSRCATPRIPPTSSAASDAGDRRSEAALALAAARPWDAASPAERAPRPDAAPPISTRRTRARSSPCLRREAGKTLPDAVSELREAVDFLRYYAAGRERLSDPARGRHRLHLALELPAGDLHRPDRRGAGRRQRACSPSRPSRRR